MRPKIKFRRGRWEFQWRTSDNRLLCGTNSFRRFLKFGVEKLFAWMEEGK